MKEQTAKEYRCPVDQKELDLRIHRRDVRQILEGELVCPMGHVYPIQDGVAQFVNPAQLESPDLQSKEQYDRMTDIYDTGAEWLFKSFYADEPTVRERMVDLLKLGPGSRVLEVGSGTGRDSIYIARRLEAGGEFFLQDLSAKMLEVCEKKLAGLGLDDGAHGNIEYFVGNASSLPFPDRSFQAAFHFGAINTFSEPARCLAEMTRVVQPGGQVVIGDEGLAPWLRDSTYGMILTNTNPLYHHSLPLAILPVNAQDVHVQWLLGNAFYLIDYQVGEGAPEADLDLTIPGTRGGTHRTRYYGTLEGVSEQAKGLAKQAASKANLSIYEWLDRAVQHRAQADLDS